MPWAWPDRHPRRVVERFSHYMEQKLTENDHKGGWDACDTGYLLCRLKQEVGELEAVIRAGGDRVSVGLEAADVANFAMMLWDRTQPLKADLDERGRA